ncbi:Ig-like domain-containing protein [Kriegella aquimaris]|uniref:Ig-like domain-containing protein n=1 Tax=Kriegella aquimaris TaxID=192904 RepID=A0A1G9LPI9_9FLAO|nr:Ig-like domain-containing protein [Kriegella aquimaris]SDL63405.1 Ig-like domain-containing protein [Kriegella aquimaris]
MKKIESKIKYRSFIFTLLGLFAFLLSCENDLEDEIDIVNPYVVSYNPVPGVDGVALNSNLVLTFDDIVYKGSGKITITSDVELAKQVIDVNDEAVTISNVGRVMTINPQDFLSGRDYQVVIDRGIVVDSTGNAYFGMPDNETWTFKSGGNARDLDAPELATQSPTDDDTEASVFGLVLTFNEGVKTAAGSFVIYDASTDAPVHTIDAEGEMLVIDEDKLSITYPAPLSFDTNYYVQFESGVVKDIAGNPFGGITDATTWNFKTVAGSGTDLVVHLPFDSDLADISGNKFDATLGETATADVSFENDATRGGVIRFNAGSYARLPVHPLLRSVEATDDFSVNLWIKLAGTDSDPAIIGNKDWGSGGNPGWLLATDDGHEYAPGNGTDHGWIVNIADDPKNDNRMDWRAAATTPQAPALSDDQWHMVTMVFDRTNSELSVYIDGQEFESSAIASSFDLSTVPGPLYDTVNDYPITIWEDVTGAYNASDDRRGAMTGLMDELKIYNKALSLTEVTALFAE